MGKDVANPSATILCMSLLLRERFGVPEAADIVERALDEVLAEASAPWTSPGRADTVSGSEFTSHVRARVQKLAEKAKPQSA